MLVIYYGETPLVNCGPQPILIQIIVQSTASTVLLHSLQTNIIFHTIRLILCFQQASEIDNLIVKLGQSNLVVLCRLHVGTRISSVAPHYVLSPTTFRSDLISYWFDNLSFILRENFLLHSAYCPLGVSQRTCELHVSIFNARTPIIIRASSI